MRLGGPVYGDTSTPEAWIATVRSHGYRAAYCPLKHSADDETVRAYAQAAAEADIVIAEVGAWSNPLSPDAETRQKAVEFCRAQLHLADRIGARCCVNIAGSRGPKWDGPSPLDLTRETFAQIVGRCGTSSTPSSRLAPTSAWKRCRGCTRIPRTAIWS